MSDLKESYFECFGLTKVNKRNCSFTWLINHFSTVHCIRPNFSLESPMFSDANDDFKWYLRLAVRSDTGYTSLHLNYSKLLDRTPSKGEEYFPVSGKLELSLLDEENIKRYHQQMNFSFEDNTSSVIQGFSKFVSNSDLKSDSTLLIEDTLMVFCALTYIKQTDIELINDQFIPLEPSKSNIFKDFEKYYLNEKFSDVVISVGKCNFPAHKCVLSLSSPVFEAEFSHDMKESQENRVCIKGIKEDVVKEMLYFMYTGKLKNLDVMTPELLEVADRFDLKELKNRCVEALSNKLCEYNVIESLIIADTFNVENLKAQAIRLVRTRCPEKEIINPEIAKDLLSSHPHLLAEILNSFVNHCKKMNTSG